MYLAHRDAYQKMFSPHGDSLRDRLGGLRGDGGSASEEFLAESEVGEDTFVRCVESGYAANVEAVATAVPDAIPYDGLPDLVVHDTGDTRPSRRWWNGPTLRWVAP